MKLGNGTTRGLTRLVMLVGAVMLLAPASAQAQGADLSVAATDSADPVGVGSEFTYNLTIANAGPDAATGVELTDTLPNEVGFVSASASQGTCAIQGSKRVECALGNLAAGASASVEIRVRAERAGQATNAASVSGSPADPTTSNDEDSEVTTIQDPAAGAACAGQSVTLIGTAGADTLTGTDKRDVIAGLDGDDVIMGLGKDDVICGGSATTRSNPGTIRTRSRPAAVTIASAAARATTSSRGAAAMTTSAAGPATTRSGEAPATIVAAAGRERTSGAAASEPRSLAARTGQSPRGERGAGPASARPGGRGAESPAAVDDVGGGVLVGEPGDRVLARRCPGVDQSQTPVGNTCWSVVHCASVNVTDP